MTNHPSLIKRLAVGKAMGFACGLLGLLLLPLFLPDASWLLRIGILLWYTTLGGIIGLVGVLTYHPVLHLPLPWWVRAPLVGAWMNFVLVFFAYQPMQAMLASIFSPDGVLSSPFWFVLEGLLVGLLIGWLATKFGGQGKALLDEQGPVG